MRISPSGTLTSLITLILCAASSQSLAVGTPLSLNELYRTGLPRSETLAFEQEDLIQARETYDRAKGALVPNLSLLGTYFRQEESLSTLGQSVSPPVQRNWRLTARQPLFRGGAEYYLLKQTRVGIEAAEKSVSAAHQAFYLEVANLYFALLVKDQELFHARNQSKLFEDQIRELRARVRIGRNRASELLNVEAAGAQISATLRTLEAEQFTLRQQLQSLIGASELAIREEIPFQGEPLAPLAQYLEWSQHAPGIRAAILAREASERSIRIAKAGHYPSLDLSGNYYFHREGGVNSSINWDVLATLSVPIFAGGTVQSAVRQAASQYRQATIQAGRVVRTTLDDVINLHRTLAAAEAELKELQNARDLAKRSYDRIVKDFRYGLSNNLELIQALRTLQEAEVAYDRARLTRMQNRIQLEVVSGRLPPAL